jgi:hypothetical protein
MPGLNSINFTRHFKSDRLLVDSGPSIAPDHLLTISSIRRVCLLELLPDPLLQRYCFRADVRHEDSANDLGEVGIYFADRQYAWAKGVDHCFWELVFNDIQDPRHGNRVGLRCRRYRPRWGEMPGHNFTRDPGSAQSFFAPAMLFAGQALTWRKLAVEVTPEQVRVFWENDEIGKISCEEMRKIIGESLTTPKEPIDPPPDSSPGVALGLFLSCSTASFRSVVVEPLEK